MEPLLRDANTSRSTTSRADSSATHAAACNRSGDPPWSPRAEGADRRPKRLEERKKEMKEGWTTALAEEEEEEMETEDGTMNFGMGG